MKIGNTSITNCKIGSNQVSSVRIGSTLIWSNTPAYDADAQAFITATGITDNTQKNAINTLVVDLKGYSIWTKFKAIYPFVGGTATTHKWNLKNPLDTDLAFRLVFSGGWIHSATGAKPNGTNAYANTFLIPKNDLITNYCSLHYYSRTSTPENGAGGDATSACVIGVRSDNDAFVNNALSFYVRTSPSNFNIFFATFTGATNNYARYVEPIGTGLYSGSLSVANSKVYKNGVNVTIFNTSASRATPNLVTYIGALNGKGSPIEFSLKESAFAGIAESMSDTEIANLYTAVQAFNTSLSRQI